MFTPKILMFFGRFGIPVLGLLLSFLMQTAHADVWARLDARGVPHFASEKLDERYQLFFRDNGQPVDPAPELLEMPRAVPVPTVPARLVAFFEVAPAFKQVKHHLREAAQAFNLEFELLQAVIATESGFDAGAASHRGAVGLMQIMPRTGQRLGLTGDLKTVARQLLDPRTNVLTGSRYLRYLLNLYGGQVELALAAYNSGEGTVARAGGRVPPIKETQDFVRTVTNLYAWLRPPPLVVARQTEQRAARARERAPEENLPLQPSTVLTPQGVALAGGAWGRSNSPSSGAGSSASSSTGSSSLTAGVIGADARVAPLAGLVAEADTSAGLGTPLPEAALAPIRDDSDTP